MGKFSLVGVDGNAFAVMGYTARALRRAGLGDQVDKMYEEAESGNYYHLITTCDGYISKANEAYIGNMAREQAKKDSQFKSGYALNPLDDLDEDEEDC